jgi:hypothetical protein
VRIFAHPRLAASLRDLPRLTEMVLEAAAATG